MKNLPEIIRNRQTTAFGRDPFQDLLSLQRKMDNLFEDIWSSNGMPVANKDSSPSSFFTANFIPTCDVDETDTHYLLSFDVPGLKKEDINIDAKENIITVSGERKGEYESKKKSSYLTERSWNSFSRSISLPLAIKVDQIEAQYADGVLRMVVPKAEITKTQHIKIGDAKSGFLDKFKSSGASEKH